MSREYTGLVEFEFCSGQIIFGRVISLGLKNSNNFWLPLIILVIYGHFQLKFGMYMYHKNTQVNFRYGTTFCIKLFSAIIFSNVMHLDLCILIVVGQFLTSPDPYFDFAIPAGTSVSHRHMSSLYVC